MNVSPRQLQAFVAVAECQSFAEAATRIHMSQPALSIAIKKLEDTVGGKLLLRTTRTLALTPEGQAFLPVARRLLADWDDALGDLHNLFAKKKGKLAIAAMPSFAANQLPEVLSDYHRQFPNINVLVDDVVAEAVVEQVRSGRAEVGVAFTPDDGADLDFRPLFTDRFVAVMPADHPLAVRESIRWRALADYPLLLLQRPSSIRYQLEQSLKATGLPVNVAFEAHQLATIGRMVASGLGVSAVPTLCTRQMEALGAVCRPLTHPVTSRQVGVLTRRRYPLSAAADAMVDALAKRWPTARGSL